MADNSEEVFILKPEDTFEEDLESAEEQVSLEEAGEMPESVKKTPLRERWTTKNLFR